MKAFYTVSLLIISNFFMTLAWYGHLKMQGSKQFGNPPPLRSCPSKLVYRSSGVFIPSTSQSRWVQREWRTVYTYATKGYSGSHFSSCLHLNSHIYVQRREPTMEPHSCFRMSDTCCILRFLKVKSVLYYSPKNELPSPIYR